MPSKVRTVDYFYMTVQDKPGAAAHVLYQLATVHINLLAFSAVPVGPDNTQLVLFPEETNALIRGAEKVGFVMNGPHRAFLVQGDDHLGALVSMHEKLSNAGINVYASTGVSDGRGGFGYVMYVKEDKFDDAVRVLGV